MRLLEWKLYTLSPEGVDTLQLDECEVETESGLLVVRFPRPVVIHNGDVLHIDATVELTDEEAAGLG